jgi:hypothetical protein
MTFRFDSQSIGSAGSTLAIPNPQKLGLLGVFTPSSHLLIHVSQSAGKEPESFWSVQLIAVCPIVLSYLCPI